MKVPIEWLKELVSFRAGADQLAEMLSLAGLETNVVADGVLDVDVLPNRADAWSIRGIAREVSAVTKFKLKAKRGQVRENNKPIGKFVKVEVRDRDLSPRYMARVIENVKVGESPEWLKKRLEAGGIRPINNVVDVTNYLLLELGQPMHAFDAALIKDGTIIVRRANPGEKLVTLDGAEQQLGSDVLIIADPDKAIAVAGVMGGANTQIGQGTSTVILESAYFDPISVHKTSKLLKLRSESSVRFEHGVDWQGVPEALDRGAALIAELGKGHVLKGRVDEKGKEPKPKVIELRPARVRELLGIELSEGEIFTILKRLGFKVTGRKVTVPSFRAADICREIDLIEEVARIYGYGNIPAAMPNTSFPGKSVDWADQLRSAVAEIMIGCGFNEVQTYSMIGPKDFELLGESAEETVRIGNPMNVEESIMRPQLISGLLKVLSHNLNRQQENVFIFEIGRVFKPSGKKLPDERWKLAAVATGSPFMSALDKGEVDYAYMKGVLENLAGALGLEEISIIQTDDQLIQPGKGGGIQGVGEGSGLGVVGELHSEIIRRGGLKKPVYFFEIDLDELQAAAVQQKQYSPLPKYPAMARDVAMFVPAHLDHRLIVELIETIGGELVEQAFVFDKYKDSLAYRIIYRSAERTLTDQEVNSKQDEIVRALESKLNVRIRK